MLEMAASARPDRVCVVSEQHRLTATELSALADGGAAVVSEMVADHVVYVGTGGIMLPLLMFAAARAARPFCPLNYRLSRSGVHELLERLPGALIVVDADYLDVVAGVGDCVMESAEFLQSAQRSAPVSIFADSDDVAVVLFTSGTTSQPKAVELTHNNLTSYVMGTVEFDAAATEDGALVCVPPYHIAGVGAALSNLYAGRKTVYLRNFEPREWVRLIDTEKISTATVVPTMLDRIVAVLEQDPKPLPTLKNLAYGGSKVSQTLVRKSLRLLPQVGFVNAYGLTETSSTLAVLTPDDHRIALGSDDECVARRLGSVGRPLPGIEVQIRADDGAVVNAGEVGELYVRGDQVSGRYREIGSVLDSRGWFATGDAASMDGEGYLFIAGRRDDTIIRGGENIAPAEIEDVLADHPDVRDVAVVGADDPEWGQQIVAVVVATAGCSPDADSLRQHVKTRLRGSRTPDRVVFVEELPTTSTGKVLRRKLVDRLKLTSADQ